MRISTLANVADESRTMLSGGLAYSSHQWGVGHIGTAVHFLAQIGAAQVGRRSSAPCFFGNAWPACGVEKLSGERGFFVPQASTVVYVNPSLSGLPVGVQRPGWGFQIVVEVRYVPF